MARTIRKLPFLLLSIFSLSRPRPIYIQLIKIPLFRCLLNFWGSSFIRNSRRWTPHPLIVFKRHPQHYGINCMDHRKMGPCFTFQFASHRDTISESYARQKATEKKIGLRPKPSESSLLDVTAQKWELACRALLYFRHSSHVSIVAENFDWNLVLALLWLWALWASASRICRLLGS